MKAKTGKCKKSPIIISNIKKIDSAVAATKPVITQLAASSLPMQILLTRKVGGDQNTMNTNNQHHPLSNITVTSIKSRGNVLKRSDEESVEINKLSNQALDNINCTAVNTEEIMKKFRIPKGIALTPKFANDVSVVGTDITSTAISHLSTALISPSPPCISADDGDNSSALVEYVEEIYDDEDETEVINAEEIESCEYQECDETDIENAEVLEENDLIEEIDSSDQQDLIISGDAENYTDSSNNNSEILLATTCPQQTTATNIDTNSITPQVIQVAQSNGTIACFQLPPNIIMLQSPDGALLATTMPHPSKPGQHQIIAIQDINSLSDLQNISAISATAPSTSLTPTNAAIIITADGSNLPVVPSTSVNSTTSPNIVPQTSNAAGIITSNESVGKAQQQQQVLA